MNAALRFNPSNVWASCQQCNTTKSGNLTEYRKVLISKLGEEKVEWLDNYNEIHRWTIHELKVIHDKYRDKVKQLELC